MSFFLHAQSGEHSRQSRLTNDPRTRIVLFLMGQLVAALRTNDPALLSVGCMGDLKTLESLR